MTEAPTMAALQQQIERLAARVAALENPPVRYETEATRLRSEGYRPGFPPRMSPAARREEYGDGHGWPCARCGHVGQQSLKPFVRMDGDTCLDFTRLWSCSQCGHTSEG